MEGEIIPKMKSVKLIHGLVSRPVNGKTGTGSRKKKIRVRIIRGRGSIISQQIRIVSFFFFFLSIIGRIIFNRGTKQCISYTGGE